MNSAYKKEMYTVGFVATILGTMLMAIMLIWIYLHKQFPITQIESNSPSSFMTQIQWIKDNNQFSIALQEKIATIQMYCQVIDSVKTLEKDKGAITAQSYLCDKNKTIHHFQFVNRNNPHLYVLHNNQFYLIANDSMQNTLLGGNAIGRKEIWQYETALLNKKECALTEYKEKPMYELIDRTVDQKNKYLLTQIRVSAIIACTTEQGTKLMKIPEFTQFDYRM